MGEAVSNAKRARHDQQPDVDPPGHDEHDGGYGEQHAAEDELIPALSFVQTKLECVGLPLGVEDFLGCLAAAAFGRTHQLVDPMRESVRARNQQGAAGGNHAFDIGAILQSSTRSDTLFVRGRRTSR